MTGVDGERELGNSVLSISFDDVLAGIPGVAEWWRRFHI